MSADWLFAKLPSSRKFWLFAWLIWFFFLWYLSSRNHTPPDGPEIPHLDKVLHFGYFACGGFAFAYFLSSFKKFRDVHVFLISLLVGAAVGALDEYHQTFTEGRYGNDIYDWYADVLGTLCGTLALIMFKCRKHHHRHKT